MKLVCNSPKCGGKDIPYALVDGYPVGDTLLEGVLFQVSIENNQLKVEIDLSCADYFSQFNKSVWYKRIEKYFLGGGYDNATCSLCNEEEYIEIK